MAEENEESRDRIAAGNYKKLALCQDVVASNVDILNEIFKHLDGVSLAMASCVSKKWKQATDDEGLWEGICTRNWPSTASLESGQLKSVVVGLGGFRRLYINCVYPLLSRNKSNHKNSKSGSISQEPSSSSGKQKWSKDEINLSLSLFSIDRYCRIPPVDRMAGIVRKPCLDVASSASASASAFTSDVHRLREEWRGIPVPIHSSKKIRINTEDAKYCWGSMDSKSSPK